MATTKVSQLTELTSAADDDLFLVADVSTNQSKKITKANLGISDENFTSALKTKLDGIEASADVTDTTNVVAALTAGTNITIAGDGTISATDTDTGILNVVEDTTPQLGGDLDTNGNDINFGDSDKAQFGAGNDLQIYHDGSHSYLRDLGTGNLFLDASHLYIRDSDGYQYISCLDNGSGGTVTLKHNDSAKLATTSTGVSVTGNVAVSGTVDGRDVATDGTKLDGIESGATADQTKSDIDALGIDAATLDGVDSTSFLRSDATATKTSGNLKFNDNIQLQFGTGADFEIYHNGSNTILSEVGTGDLLLYTNGASFQVDSNAGENMINADPNGAVRLYYDNSNKLETTSGGIDVTGNVDVSVGHLDLDTNYRVRWGASNNYSIMSDNANYIAFNTAGSERMRLESDGDLHADGDVIAYSTTISDERLKDNIQPIDDALAKVKQLKGCTFTYTADGKESAGLIAQDVEKVLPSAVSEKELPLKQDDGIAYKTLQYDQTIGLLVEAIKELSAKVEELENR